MSKAGALLPPIHREGYRFALIFFVVSLGLFWLAEPLGWVGLVLTLWCLYFFRDPVRMVPDAPGLIIAPADGIVLPIGRHVPPAELELGDEPRLRVSIFMNVFNVHVNRAPASGKITKTCYIAGKFFNASLDKASEFNERQLVAMKTDDGKSIAFVQIAGLVARRIICGLKEGDEVETGERFGLIRFGSRVDVYLDEGLEPLVAEGQTMIAGETILADGRHGESQRQGQEI